MSSGTESTQGISVGERVRKVLRFLWLEYSALFALILLMVIASILNPRFLTFRNLSNITRQVSVIGIVAIGMTVVIISGGIDLSVGSVLALSAVAGMSALNTTGSIVVSLLTTLAVAILLGLINGTLITRGKLAPFIATLGMMAAARSLATFFVRGGNVVGEVEAYTAISRGVFLGFRYPVYVFLMTAIVIGVLMNRTRFGRYVYATGSNEKATMLSAVNTSRVKLTVYGLCSGLVAVAAIMESATLNSISSANSGHMYELDAIAAVIIGGARLEGGRGYIAGTVIGVLLLGVLNNVLNLMDVSPFLQGFVKGLIIIVAVLVQRKSA